MQESMRMYPVAGGTVRQPKQDVLLGGRFLIPKHVTVFVPVSSQHFLCVS
jgi:cytochrome P450